MKKDNRKTGGTTPPFEGKDPGNLLIIIYLAAIVFFVLLGSFTETRAAEAPSDWQKVRMEEAAGGELRFVVFAREPGPFSSELADHSLSMLPHPP